MQQASKSIVIDNQNRYEVAEVSNLTDVFSKPDFLPNNTDNQRPTEEVSNNQENF